MLHFNAIITNPHIAKHARFWVHVVTSEKNFKVQAASRLHSARDAKGCKEIFRTKLKEDGDKLRVLNFSRGTVCVTGMLILYVIRV